MGPAAATGGDGVRPDGDSRIEPSTGLSSFDAEGRVEAWGPQTGQGLGYNDSASKLWRQLEALNRTQR